MSYTLNGSAVTITLPPYPATAPYQYEGNSMVPSQSAAGSVLTIQISQNKFDTTAVVASGKTAILYTSLEVNKQTTFGNGSTSVLIPVTLMSPCLVMGTTYTTTESSSGATLYSETDTVTQSGMVTGHIETAVNPFPANTVVDVTVSH